MDFKYWHVFSLTRLHTTNKWTMRIKRMLLARARTHLNIPFIYICIWSLAYGSRWLLIRCGTVLHRYWSVLFCRFFFRGSSNSNWNDKHLRLHVIDIDPLNFNKPRRKWHTKFCICSESINLFFKWFLDFICWFVSETIRYFQRAERA